MSMTGTSVERGDRELEQLAAEPARPLFPLLDHAEAMIPFVVVLAFLPALYAVTNRTLTESGAWLGLAGLRCLSITEPMELFDPTASDEEPAEPSLHTGAATRTGPAPRIGAYPRIDQSFRFQPPLMAWLTALAMKVFGIGNAAGLVAAAYFCTAALLVASYVLARRLGGEQLGLMTVVLLAFNPQILQGAQEPVPQSAANLFAVLALAGLIVHWQKSSAFVSYYLLLAGIALGTCLVAGGPVALAVILIAVVYALAWKCEVWRRDRGRLVWDRSLFSRRTALRSTLALAATAFAFGGWTALLPASRHGVEFWSEWLAGPGVAAAPPDQRSTAPSFFAGGFPAAFWEMNRLSVPIFALALLGMAAIARELWVGEEDPGKRHRGILLVWIAIALFAWLLVGGPLSHGAPIIAVWETLLTVPLVIAAALGLIDIAERRVGFAMSLSIGVVVLVDSALWVRQWLDNGPPPDLAAVFSSMRDWDFVKWGLGIVLPLTLIALATALAALAGRGHTGASEKRRRIVLCGLLVTTILLNCLWGAIAVRRTNSGDRELDDLRAGLSRLARVDRCTFVALAPPGRATSLQPPAQIIYALASLWPQASLDFAGSWESAMRPPALDAGRTAPAEPGVAVFMAWSPRGRVRGTAPDTNLKTAAAPFLYQGMEFVAYVRDPAPPPRAEDSDSRISAE